MVVMGTEEEEVHQRRQKASGPECGLQKESMVSYDEVTWPWYETWLKKFYVFYAVM